MAANRSGTSVTATLGEGNTPLIESVQIGPARGAKLWFKLETCNPTGSYKDRFVAAQATHMLEQGARSCVATSSGNTGSALAAYCARYRIRCVILVNEDAPAGKLAQMQAHGARVLRIPQFTVDPALSAHVFEQLRRFSAAHRVPLVVSAFRYCPEGMRGVQTLSHEVSRALKPDHVFVPVGGGGLYSAIVQGFQECGGAMPRVHAVQPEGCSTVVAAFLRGDEAIHPVSSTTRISGLSVPSDIDATLALQRLRECGGAGLAVSDEEVFAAQSLLFEQEGVYSEPAGAAGLAGWLRVASEGRISRGETAVCVITGHGFKDPVSANAAAARHPAVTVAAPDLGGYLETLAVAERGDV